MALFFPALSVYVLIGGAIALIRMLAYDRAEDMERLTTDSLNLSRKLLGREFDEEQLQKAQATATFMAQVMYPMLVARRFLSTTLFWVVLAARGKVKVTIIPNR